nr:carbohydrate ABC transporter permease [Clostridia bacterium]
MVQTKSARETVFDGIIVLVVTALSVVFLYPMYYCLMASFSDPIQVIANSGLYWRPLGFSLAGYQSVFNNPNLLRGYANTIKIVAMGTTVNILLTILGAYVLSRKEMLLKKALTILIVFTMYFGGGLIPTYLVVRALGLYNSHLALILPGAIGTWNLIVMRTAFKQLPDSLEESATLDGANDYVILARIIVPLSKPTIAVILLFYAVGHWNAWFSAAIYLRDRALYPLQLILREILISGSSSTTQSASSTANMSEAY